MSIGTLQPARPVLQAFILCEHFYRDADTGKPIICGVYNQLWLPIAKAKANGRIAQTKPTHVFASMTDFVGKTDIALRFVNLRTNQVITECKLPLVSDNPLELHNIATEVPPIPITHPGVYALELHACNEIIGSLRLSIEDINTIQIEEDSDHTEDRSHDNDDSTEDASDNE